jgi:D-methionine transport system permease protein
MLHDIANALLQTIYVVLLASIPVTIIGLLISLAHISLKTKELYNNTAVVKILDFIVNASYRLPYIALIIAFIPFTRALATYFQSDILAIAPIVLATLPVFIHHASKALSSVSSDVIKMAISNGATKLQVIKNVILQESKTEMIRAYGVTLIALVSCSTIAGIIGIKGLGKLLVEKGYQTFDANYVIGIIIALVALNQIISLTTKCSPRGE